MPFLAIDIGNTRLKWALYEQALPGAPVLAHGAAFLETIDHLGESDWARLPPPTAMLGCVVAGDGIKRRVQEQLELWDIAPRWVVPDRDSGGIVNGYDHPSRLGSDRWIALIGARQRALAQGWNGPVLVVMVGTAATVDALDADGTFLGGLILPGHGIMLRALETGTAGLHVPTGQVTAFPRNTSDALTSGGTFAITGAIERMHRHLLQRCGRAPVTFMTGGAAWKVNPHLDLGQQLVETLIFDGLLSLQAHLNAQKAPR